MNLTGSWLTIMDLLLYLPVSGSLRTNLVLRECWLYFQANQAALRNYQCFSLAKLNEKILAEVNKLNNEEFQKEKALEESL